jgi:ribosomal protein L11 methyltransferase
MSRSFVELTIASDSSLSEVLVGMMNQLGFEGFWEDGERLKCYMASERWSDGMLRETESLVALVTRPSSSAAPRISLRTIQEENWNEQWERSIRPVHATSRIVISPTWQEYSPAPGELVVRINPKMSFGTGYHESTRLALKLIEQFLHQGMTVLDVGTGTGILAIASVRLGASSAIGLDSDEWAYANARENVVLNGVEEKVTILRGELDGVGSGTFDLIAANIQRSVIEPLLPGMKQRLHSDGVLVLAGLLDTEHALIRERLHNERLEILAELSENEWIALACGK